MDDASSRYESCCLRQPFVASARERGVRSVVALTAVMMVVEIVAGYATRSMALLADGWHMATHVAALGLASVAYALSRRYASHRAFAFGTGKVHALAGYTSAVALGLVALTMVVESLGRLFHPRPIDFASSLPVACVGLVVNLVSVRLLHGHDDDHAAGAPHDHDPNHRAALLHVVADTLTSALAIVALLAGRWLGWVWLDALSGVAGGCMILRWGVGLCRSTAFELLDVDPSAALDDQIRAALEAIDDVRVSDLHVWATGGGARSCIATIVSAAPRAVADYRARLASFELAHLTIEVQQREERPDGDALAPNACANS